MATALTFAALIAVPIWIGALIGLALPRRSRQRRTGLFAAAACIGIPAGLVAFSLWFPLIGIWDAIVEACLLGTGIACGAFGVLDRSRIALAVGSLVLSSIALEVGCRLFLPPPPGFFTTSGPHLLLADALRAESEGHSWNLRSKEIVCSAVYEDQYPGILDVSGESDLLVPRKFVPRPGATRRVLHIGDSMTFGLGVSRDQTFTAALERLEPDTRHINGGIPNTAPDAYLLLLRKWLEIQPLDLAVMYVFEGNDLADDEYPCCHWQTLLVYGSEGPAMRCPTASRIDFARAGTTWLQYNSPPPYLLRALIPYSSAAAHAAAAIVSRRMGFNPSSGGTPEQVALSHLESIFRSARDETRARGAAFLVVVLPVRSWVENWEPHETIGHSAPQILGAAERAGVRAYDVSETLRNAVARGERPFLEPRGDPHLSAEGNELIARWLHERLSTPAGDD